LTPTTGLANSGEESYKREMFLDVEARELAGFSRGLGAEHVKKRA
jgi:hypothetical protein